MTDFFPLRVFDFLPWFLEEEGEIPDHKQVAAPEQAEEDFLKALELWVNDNKGGRYKFIGILLNTETSGFEREVKKYITTHRNVLRDESGENFLILHGYTQPTEDESSGPLREKTYSYIQKLKVERVGLPSILIFPGAAMTHIKDKSEAQPLVINIEQEAGRWDGELTDYFTVFFRCLFDSIDNVDFTEKRPTHCLNKEFRKKLKNELGYSLVKETTSIVNMPVIGHVVKLITLMI
ncbi:MAG: hypothetical protein KKC76_10755 [Proteobacteria bacterium]|nr:hypothetical protein [Pseudomonadota bacterium]MBU4298175.1 hypothetical protein [Pseudomonadota bacterium]MCG2749678.1 hypothetical protein [Desulfobulbaceae bacterium]